MNCSIVVLANGWFELGVDIFDDEILCSFEESVLGARKETGQVSEDGLSLAARVLPRL